jgi:hypothetical protein
MQIPMPDHVSIEGRAELLGVTLPQEPVETGQSVAVRLFFNTLGQMPDNESWRVSLVNVNDHSQVAVRGRAEPWTPDTIEEYDVVIPLPKDLQPGTFALQVSLWDEAGGHEVAQFPIPESAAQLEVMSP